ncbi:hypothetical protein ABPG74_005188 [Tetrahymena malaccensis]
MIKVLLLATLLISTCFADKCHPNYYYGVEDNQPFAVGVNSFYHEDDNGEYNVNESFQSYITEFYNGTYVVEGTYQQKVQAYIYNQYVGCYNSIYERIDRKSFNYTRQGVRTNSQFGQNLTLQEVQPPFNTTLKRTLKQFAIDYSTNSTSFYYYQIVKALDSMAESIQVDNISEY